MDLPDETGLQLPGFGLTIQHARVGRPRFAHGVQDWSQAPAVTARELAMTAMMNKITDLPNWCIDVFDDAVTSIWQQEKVDLMSEQAWEWCIMELRDKAKVFQEQGFVRVLDTGSSICKTDGLDLDFSEVGLVDPQMYPLVYGETRVLHEGETVGISVNTGESNWFEEQNRSGDRDSPSADHVNGLNGSVEEHHSGFHPSVAPTQYNRLARDPTWVKQAASSRADKRYKASWRDSYRRDIQPSDWFHSWRYQCLPCEVELPVKIVSYINNLALSPVYHKLESLIARSIPMWNDCIIKSQLDRTRPHPGSADQTQRGRYPLRIITYGAEWHDRLPEWARPLCERHIEELQQYQAALRFHKEYNETIRSCEVNHVELEDAETLYNQAREAYKTIVDLEHLYDLPPVAPITDETWRLAAGYLGSADREDIGARLTQEASRRQY